MTKEELDIQKEIENYFTESTGFGRDKIRNFMDIVNKALKQKGERIEELENKIADIKANCDLAIEGRDIKIKELEQTNNKLLDVINNQDVKIADLEKQIEKMKSALIDIKSNTDDVNIEWQIKYLFDELEIKENANLKSNIKREIFPEITLPEESAEFVDKVIADAEKRLKESE